MVNVKEKYVSMPVRNKDNGRRSVTQMLTVHSAECPLRRGYAKSLTGWLNAYPPEGPWSSINTFADPGVVVRSVSTWNAAWHASWANAVSIGYETAAYARFTRAQWMTLEGRRMLERLAIEMAEDAKIFDIPLRWLTGEQVNKIKAGNRKIKGLSAHRQIDPVHRSDPGDGFPYGYLLKRIKHHSGVKPPKQEEEMSKRDIVEALIEAGPELADIILDRPVKLADGGKTTLRKKITWLFHEQNRAFKAIQSVTDKLDGVVKDVHQVRLNVTALRAEVETLRKPKEEDENG